MNDMTHCSHGISYDKPCSKCDEFRTKEMIAWHKEKLESHSGEPYFTIEQARELAEKAHMAGQADAGIDPSYSNAQVYCSALLTEKQ